MLTVQIRDAAKALAGMAEVEILCDADGLALLIQQVEPLKKGSPMCI
ncbi:MAG: hypothetical protein IT389_14205 [Nitrospira sp.]|nr:hypothetical protein [Nitrospira sp.]